MQRPVKQMHAFRFSDEIKGKLKELSGIYDKSMTDVLVQLIEERHRAKTREAVK